MYVAVKLAGAVVMSQPAPLPKMFAGWAAKPSGAAALADIAAAIDPCPADWQGVGLWPVLDEGAPEHDAVTEDVVPGDLVADRDRQVVVQRWTVAARPDAAARLAERRQETIREVRTAAGLAIAAWVPPGWDLAYAEKHRQALIVQAGGAAGQALIREAAARQCSVAALATMITAKADAWDAALGDIEDHRLAAEAAIAAAASGAEIDQILKDIRWPSP